MNIGLVGLGKMGSNLIRNIKSKGYDIVGYDQNQAIYNELNSESIKTASSISELVNSLEKPRTIILLVPNGKITQECFEEVLKHLDENDTIIDSGNSFYKDSINRYNIAKEKNINFVDCGISGGISGARNGACLMVGGEDKALEPLHDFFKSIAVENGYLHTGKPGSGHFCKMIHNGIEYGMMQSIAEGYELLERSDFDYDLEKVSLMWNNGSVIRSWLIELMIDAFKNDPKLESLTGEMDMNGEGLWTVQEALEQGTPVPTISLSVMMRQRSKFTDTFSGKVVSSLRKGFGGHAVVKKKK
ncbi:phosphogluconate dehydrogenase (NAD(+)-dependent, decarboxylating) [Mycoplasma yeatsii]|uniref:6-phosphogluconate dehydrogenase n=1 Tax=Mycoplasma yeatsii TaxID=51365 RepID=A0ABU0NE91_9MOLU|nr:decarboxylating 6-phosphogluconate dehydrogenase [Mycoplasma yeatsii]MDQ0567432.1 6-phosphogluconate dehydrogenase [Mycoplasma yeatsii]